MFANEDLIKGNEMGIFNIFKYMFSEWVADMGYDTDEMVQANPGRFVEWARQHWDEIVVDKWEEISPKLQANADAFKYSCDVLRNDWKLWQWLFAWWPMLTLSGRQPLKNQPTAMTCSIGFKFKDGREFRFDMNTANEGEEHFKHDGPLCTLLRVQLNRTIDAISDNGLDALYGRYAKPAIEAQGCGAGDAATEPAQAPEQKDEQV